MSSAYSVTEFAKQVFPDVAEPEKDLKCQILAKMARELLGRSLLPSQPDDLIKAKIEKCKNFLSDSLSEGPENLALDLYLSGVRTQTLTQFFCLKMEKHKVEEIIPDASLSSSGRARSFSQ